MNKRKLELKVVSRDVHQGGAKGKVEEIYEQLRHWNPGVVGLSEFRESASSKAIARLLSEMGLVQPLTTSGARQRGVTKLGGR